MMVFVVFVVYECRRRLDGFVWSLTAIEIINLRRFYCFLLLLSLFCFLFLGISERGSGVS